MDPMKPRAYYHECPHCRQEWLECFGKPCADWIHHIPNKPGAERRLTPIVCDSCSRKNNESAIGKGGMPLSVGR